MYCVLLELEIFGCCYHVEGKVQHMLGITIGVMKHFPALEKVSDFYKVETAHYCRFLKVQNEWVVFKNESKTINIPSYNALAVFDLQI